MTSPKAERRRAKRVRKRVPVKLKLNSGEEEESQTRDLSERGIFVFSQAPIGPGSQIELMLVLPRELNASEKQLACCVAEVVRVDSDSAGRQAGIAAVIRRFDVMPQI